MANSPDYNIAVLESALKVLEAFLPNGHAGKTLNDLSKATELTRTRAFRILSTLQNHGYVYQDRQTHQYYLGLKLLQLGQRVYGNLGLVQAAQPVLTRLGEQTGETVFIGVLDGKDAVCIDRRNSPHSIRLFAEIGARTPLHVGTVPKILLAYQSPEFIDEYLRGPLVRINDQTVTDPVTIRALLDDIRRCGVTMSRDDMDLGAVSIGAPVHDRPGSGAVIAAISVAGPESRFPADQIQQVKEYIRQAADEIERRLG
jgi:IclR family transcriptional regulator, KDG regulon repressor